MTVRLHKLFIIHLKTTIETKNSTAFSNLGHRKWRIFWMRRPARMSNSVRCQGLGRRGRFLFPRWITVSFRYGCAVCITESVSQNIS